MLLRLTLATLHLLALGIGLGAVYVRGRELRQRVSPEMLRRAFAADSWWGIAAVLWLATGAWRALASMEKATAYYLQNPLFHAKMGLFLLVFLLELWPMVTLIRWRRGATPSDATARRIATISMVQTTIVIVIVALAAAMARGLGAR